ncbi:MAG: hypothetical protein K9J42_02855 [Sulfuritalea sp.]|nr:hypothetical protein [Sulfuritalea sp.]
MKFPLVYDATTSRQDFVRLLPMATGTTEYEEIDGIFRGKGWTVHLIQIPPLEIGMVRLERHRIEIEFDGLDADTQDRFMQRFTSHYQRGGG